MRRVLFCPSARKVNAGREPFNSLHPSFFPQEDTNARLKALISN